MADQQTQQNREGVYHDVSPAILNVVRVIGLITTAMVVLSFIFCIAKGVHESALYLLAFNTVISALVGLVNGWWYRQGDLSAEKYWFLIVLCIVILFQCFTTDIFVFNIPQYAAPTTIAPLTTEATTAG